MIGNKADTEGSEARFKALRQHLVDTKRRIVLNNPIGCVAVSALKAGYWDVGEYEKEAEVWKSCSGLLRRLVN